MAIDVSKLQVALEEEEQWRRTLRITVPSELVQAERRVAIRKLSARMQLPGFRAGKVPARVVERRFGPAIEQELLDRLIGEAYRGVLADRDLRPISEGQVGEIEYEVEADLKFQISFDIAPQVELARLGGFQIEAPPVRVTDEDMDRVLNRIREQKGTWVPVDEGRPEEGNRVAVRIQQLDQEDDDPRPYEFTLGADEAVPDVEQAIQTLDVGESGDFTVTVPGDPQDPEQGPVTQELKIFLDGRKELELPDLTDEMAQSVGEFEGLDDLKQRIRDDLEAEAKREAEAELRARLMEQVLAANPFDIPESMVDEYVRSVLGNPKDLDEERFAEAKKQFRPRAVQGVKRFMVVDRIAESQGLKASSDEVDDRIEEIAERADSTPSEVYTQLQKSGRLDELEREITENKVFEFLKQKSEIKPSQDG